VTFSPGGFLGVGKVYFFRVYDFFPPRSAGLLAFSTVGCFTRCRFAVFTFSFPLFLHSFPQPMVLASAVSVHSAPLMFSSYKTPCVLFSFSTLFSLPASLVTSLWGSGPRSARLPAGYGPAHHPQGAAGPQAPHRPRPHAPGHAGGGGAITRSAFSHFCFAYFFIIVFPRACIFPGYATPFHFVLCPLVPSPSLSLYPIAIFSATFSNLRTHLFSTTVSPC